MNKPLTDEQNEGIETACSYFFDQIPPSWPLDARQTVAWKLAYWSVTLECSDNWRWCRCSVPSELADYCNRQNRGCCGFRDEVVMENGEAFLVGCNYGH